MKSSSRAVAAPLFSRLEAVGLLAALPSAYDRSPRHPGDTSTPRRHLCRERLGVQCQSSLSVTRPSTAMQLTMMRSVQPAAAAARPARSSTVAVVAQQQPEAVSRRAALSGLVALPALLAAAPALALGKDVRKAMAEKEARRQKLKESAAKMKASQKSEAAFADSKYSLPEDATTPNMRTLANDRLRVED
ncbi:hypothetical protein ABPG75_013693 [Micractinium tetrahymenae]